MVTNHKIALSAARPFENRLDTETILGAKETELDQSRKQTQNARANRSVWITVKHIFLSPSHVSTI